MADNEWVYASSKNIEKLVKAEIRFQKIIFTAVSEKFIKNVNQIVLNKLGNVNNLEYKSLKEFYNEYKNKED